MKTSVIEVHDMLSVLSVDELEKRIGEVPGVGSATVDFAAGNVTVRFDETRLDVNDIKTAVRLKGYEDDEPTETTPPTAERAEEATPAKPSPAEGAAPAPAPAPAAAPMSEEMKMPPPSATDAPAASPDDEQKK